MAKLANCWLNISKPENIEWTAKTSRSNNMRPYPKTTTEFPIPSFIEVFQLSFSEFPRLVGHYCSYLLLKEGRGTPKTKHDKISRIMG